MSIVIKADGEVDIHVPLFSHYKDKLRNHVNLLYFPIGALLCLTLLLQRLQHFVKVICVVSQKINPNDAMFLEHISRSKPQMT